MDEYNAILTSDLSDMDKLAGTFDLITGRIVTIAEREIEIARAMQDKEALVKEQIKLGMVKHTRSIFSQCFWSVTGRKVWDE